jgi:hypothetical protein
VAPNNRIRPTVRLGQRVATNRGVRRSGASNLTGMGAEAEAEREPEAGGEREPGASHGHSLP